MCSGAVFLVLMWFPPRRRTLWSTCLNTQWWNIWFPITLLNTGHSLPLSRYGSPWSEFFSPPIRDFSSDICALLMDFESINRVQKCARLYRVAILMSISSFCFFFFCWPDSIIGTSKDDFSALSDIEMTGLKNSFFYVTSQKKKLLQAATWKTFKPCSLNNRLHHGFFIWSSLLTFAQVFANKTTFA